MTRKTSESASSFVNHISSVEPIEPIKTKVSCGWSLLRGPYSTKCNCAMCFNLPFLQPLPCPGHHRCTWWPGPSCHRSEEHTSELQSRFDFVCRPLL